MDSEDLYEQLQNAEANMALALEYEAYLKAENKKQAQEIERLRAALQQALKALETCSQGDYSTGHVIDPSFDEDLVNAARDAAEGALK